jgi:hypothetical protein
MLILLLGLSHCADVDNVAHFQMYTVPPYSGSKCVGLWVSGCIALGLENDEGKQRQTEWELAQTGQTPAYLHPLTLILFKTQCSVYTETHQLKMESACTSKTLATLLTCTQCNNPWININILSFFQICQRIKTGVWVKWPSWTKLHQNQRRHTNLNVR